MPPLLVAAAGSVLAGVAAATAEGLVIFGLSGAALGFAVGGASFALSLISQALAPAPPKPKEGGFTQMVRSSVEPQRIVYGTRVVSGPLVFVTTTGKLNKFMHLVIPLAGHRVEAIGRVWFNDEVVGDLDGAGEVTTGRFEGKARIKKHLGADDQAADTDLVAEAAEWTTDHRLRGIAYIYVRLKYKAEVYATGRPNIKVEVKGRVVEDPRDASVAVASSSVAAQTTITTSAAHGLAAGDSVRLTGHTGSVPALDGEHQVLTAPTAETFTIDVNVTTGGTGGSLRKMTWSDNAALVLRDYLLAGFGLNAVAASEIDDTLAVAAANTSDEDVDLPAAVPTFTFTADAATDLLTQAPPEGKVFDKPAEEDGVKPVPLHLGDGVELSTTGTLPTGLAAATRYYAMPESATGFKLATTLANARAGTAIDITGAGSGEHTLSRKSQPRYSTNAVIQLDRRPIDIVPDLVSAMFGHLVYTQGAYAMFAGVYTGPAAVTLTESDLRSGPLNIKPRPGKQQKYNAVRGTFTDRDSDYQPTEFPPITNAAFEAEDAPAGGKPERIYKDLDLRHVTDTYRAQRLARFMLLRDRQGLTVDFPAKLSGLEIAVMDTVEVTMSQPGWSGKEFEVLGWKLAEDGGIDLALKETAAAVYAWDPDADATIVDLTPNTNLPNAFDVEPPTDLVLASADAELLAIGEGSVVSRIKASWTAADDAFVRGYEVQFKKSADTNWSLGPVTSEDETEAHVSEVVDGAAYDVRVRSVNRVGVRSAWATVLGHIVIGKTAPPPDVATFTVARRTGVRKFAFSLASVPADVRAGGGFRIRYSTDLTADWADMTALHDGLLVSSPFEINDPAAGTYLFSVKALDSSGNESANALSIIESLGASQLLNVLEQRVEEDLGWPGALVDCFRTPANTLLAASIGDLDDLPAQILGLPATIASILPSKSPITYTTPTIDLGFDVTFTPVVSADVSGALTLTMQTGLDSDGAPVGAFVALASVTARYIKIKASVSGGNPEILRMTTALDAEVATDRFEDIDTATATDAWFSSVAAGHFKAGSKSGDLVSIGLADLRLQSVGAGWTWEIVSKTQTVNGQPAAEFKVYDSTGTLADATIDVTLVGPKKSPPAPPTVRVTPALVTRVTPAGDIRIAA